MKRLQQTYIDNRKNETFRFMTYNNIKNTILTVLFGFMAFTSCIDDDYMLSGGEDYDIPEGIKEGYSINLIVTLDKMGGTRAASSYNPLEEIENYIDPEKFRVLFFTTNEETNEDLFLFESKSRWVKKLNPGSIHSEWLVSIPVFTYGNDTYEAEDGSTIEWDWERIREALTTNKFKIAILANRPELDWYPSFKDLDGVPAHWYDNRGPYWTPEDMGKRDVFELHHCQYDPMYHGKSTAEGYYDFIMGDWGDASVKYEDRRPTMGATASWVNWDDAKKTSEYDDEPNGAFSARVGSDFKYTILPNYEHPIPMYGIQEFDPITNWTKGTPFNLSDLIAGTDDYNINSISLLRSVVRVDLLLPKMSYPERPRLVGLWYPNIYSRCEPMDVWTPTNLIWEEDHENKCEWNDIMDYGLVASTSETKGNTNRYTDKKEDFQNTISWFYGAWLDKGWDFGNSVKPQEISGIKYPKIFNPCVQRNKFVICSEEGDVSDLYNDDYWHFVAYTGERNMIDPNTLPKMVGSNSYATTWMFKDISEGNKGNYYFIPIADYSKSQSYARNSFGPYTRGDWNAINDPKESRPDDSSDNFPNDHHADDPNSNTKIKQYGNNLRNEVTDKDEMPWPLLRNHVYRITVTGPTPTELTESYTWDFTKPINGTTAYNLTADDNWINPGGKKTIKLSWNDAPALSTYDEDGWQNTGSSSNVATWTKGGEKYSIMIMRSDKGQSSGGDLTINGDKYKTIKVSNGAQNKLILPEGKVTKEMTLYSYLNADPPRELTDLINFYNGNYDEQNGKITANGTTTATTVKDYGVYQLKNGYTGSGAGNNIQLKITGGFKTGDIITVAGFIDNSDASKSGTAVLFTASSYNSTSTTTIKTFNNFVNLSNGDAEIAEQSYTLTKDYDVLYLGRNGNTNTNLVVIKVQREATVNKVTNSYWKEVAGDDYTIDETGMRTYNDRNGADKFNFKFDAKGEVTFTNSGTQCCYVAFVEVENEDGGGEPCWELSNPNGELKANGKIIPELQGLRFSTTTPGSIYIYDTKPSKILLTGSTTVTFPRMPEGTIITIDGKPLSDDATSWITSGSSNLDTNGENSWRVNADGVAQFVFDGGNTGVELYEISVEVPSNARSTRAVGNGNEGGLRVESDDLHSKSLKFSRR